MMTSEKFGYIGFSAQELMEADLPPQRDVVDGLIPQGVTILSAQPKTGKSWFCLQLAKAVAQGEMFLGRATEQGRVIYIDTEERPQSLVERIQMQGQGEIPPEQLDILFGVPTMNKAEFEHAIAEYIGEKAYDDVRLIIVDTFSDIDPNNKKATENDYQYTRGIIKNLQSLAKELDASILIVYHDRKQFDTERPFANILGSTGIYSKVEGALVLHRNNEFGDSATLYQCGKSIPRAMYGTRFSETDFQWSDLQNVETMRNDDAAQAFNSDPIAKTVIRMLSECGGTKECRCTEIVNKAKEYGITITDSKKCIAQKLSIYKSKFSQYDNVDLTIINNGTGSRLYRFVDRNVDKDTSTV